MFATWNGLETVSCFAILIPIPWSLQVCEMLVHKQHTGCVSASVPSRSPFVIIVIFAWRSLWFPSQRAWLEATCVSALPTEWPNRCLECFNRESKSLSNHHHTGAVSHIIAWAHTRTHAAGSALFFRLWQRRCASVLL